MMGNCCERCLGRLDKRRYLRTRYNVERDISIEFENLMDELQVEPTDESQENELPDIRGQLELNRPFTVSSYMRWLVHQEEELRKEEEAYYEKKRETERATRANKRRETGRGTSPLNHLSAAKMSRKDPNTWLGADDSDWEMAGEEEDLFLECVRARSQAARTKALDGASESSSKDDRSRTEASSLDLEWEHEAGMQSAPKDRQRHCPPCELAVRPMYMGQTRSPKSASLVANESSNTHAAEVQSVDDEFEWDNDFVSSVTNEECRTLLSKDTNDNTSVDR